MVGHTDSSELEDATCDFNTEYEFKDDETPEPQDHTSNTCQCSWSRFRGETKSLRFSHRSGTLDGWRTVKSVPKSRSPSPDKIRKRRRAHLLRFYPQQEAGKETRSESYVFLHHGNWRQYMKQYRKYHTVGQAGRVNCEDLEWKNLLRHIKLGESLKEMLFNSSASLHPPSRFPCMDHWCKEASQAVPLPCQKISQQREKREKRNLFQSFTLASVKKKPNEFSRQKWSFSWRDGGLSQAQRECEELPAVGPERQLHDGKIFDENRHTEEILSPMGKHGKRDFDFTYWRENHNQKPKDNKLKLKKLKSGSDQQIPKMDIHADLDGVGVSFRTVNNTNLTTVLTGVNSFLHKEKNQISEYKVFQPHELGSLRLDVNADSLLERANGKKADKLDDKKKSERLRLLSIATKEKECTQRKRSKKRKVYVKLDKEEIQSFSIVSYSHLEGSERMQMKGTENNRHSCEGHTPLPRLLQPLSKHTVIWGNKYGTAEQHELDRRLDLPSAEHV